MFHRLITKYGLATHLALLASLPLALLPFLSERHLGLTILWLSALAGLWLLLEPSILADTPFAGIAKAAKALTKEQPSAVYARLPYLLEIR